MGTEVKLADFLVEHRKVLSVGDPVKDVSITGFQVSNFSLNIAVVGAQDARVSQNSVTDGEVYGFLTAGSKNTRVTGNTVVSSGGLPFIGICMDNMAGVRVSNNYISGYNIALCVQTSGADVRHNDVSNNCIGVYVDPGIDSAKVHDNNISATNPSCTTDGGLGTYGIIIGGAVNTNVQDNLIKGQSNGGLALGVAIVDDPCTELSLTCIYRNGTAALASGNVVIQNTLLNNDLDILVDTNGTGNVITNNKCSTSKPEGLCVRN
jgi:nitrous oxidase accessory protein NosD